MNHKIELETMENLCTTIKNTELEVLKTTTNIEELKIKISNYEIDVAQEVNNALDISGKPAYSNAEKRTIAINLKCKESSEYNEAKKDLQNQELSRKKLEINLNYFRNLVSVYKALCYQSFNSKN
jgi:hypothetical protein